MFTKRGNLDRDRHTSREETQGEQEVTREAQGKAKDGQQATRSRERGGDRVSLGAAGRAVLLAP